MIKRIPRHRPSLTIGESASTLFRDRGSQDAMGRFAGRFAEYIGVSHAIPAPSAREALASVLHALHLPAGGEVIMPALTFHSIPAMFRRFGLRLRFVDIDPDTYCLNPAGLEQAVNPATVAIAPVHLYGRGSEMDVISEVADRHGLAVIEDCAQGCGCRFGGQKLGSFGDAGVFSFHPEKNLSALWAGMVTTNSAELAAGVSEYLSGLPPLGVWNLTRRWLTSLGMDLVTQPWVWTGLMAPSLQLCFLLGFDPIEMLTSETAEGGTDMDRDARRMPRPIQAVIGMSQLAKVDEANRLRIRNGERLRNRLSGLSGIQIPGPAPEGQNIYLTFVITVDDRDDFRRRMLRKGIDTHPGNMFVGPRLPGLEGTGEDHHAAQAVRRMVHLPVYPQMSIEDIDQVADAIFHVLAGRNASAPEASR